LHKNFALSRKTQPPQPPSLAKAPPPTPRQPSGPSKNYRLNALLNATTSGSLFAHYTPSSSFFKHIEANKQQK
jgi:hypothetical protein